MLAGFSDGFDGLAARMTRQYTPLGQYLDPIADKLLLSTLFLVLTHMDLVPRYVTVLVFSRDLGILLIATLLFATGTLRNFRPSLLGKLNTLVQIFALTMVLVEQVWPSAGHGPAAQDLLLRRSPGSRPISAAQYAWIVVQRVNAAEPQAAGVRPRQRGPNSGLSPDASGCAAGLFWPRSECRRTQAESKTSPHSWHSTNSASSSRATTRTWGCLHDAGIRGEAWVAKKFALPNPLVNREFSLCATNRGALPQKISPGLDAARRHRAAALCQPPDAGAATKDRGLQPTDSAVH